jgi:hypothetical protein
VLDIGGAAGLILGMNILGLVKLAKRFYYSFILKTENGARRLTIKYTTAKPVEIKNLPCSVKNKHVNCI